MHIQFELISFSVLLIIICSLMPIVIEKDIAVRFAFNEKMITTSVFLISMNSIVTCRRVNARIAKQSVTRPSDVTYTGPLVATQRNARL
jgi:hypothetical protein